MEEHLRAKEPFITHFNVNLLSIDRTFVTILFELAGLLVDSIGIDSLCIILEIFLDHVLADIPIPFLDHH